MLKTCPDLLEVQDVQFKLHCRLKVYDGTTRDTSQIKQNLISCASRYGLLFVGSNLPNLQVIQLKCVENYTTKEKDISNYLRRNVPLPSSAFHVSVNCDSTILAVVVDKDKCPTVIFYDVLSFCKENIRIVTEVRLSATPGISITEIGWNPTLPAIFTACKSDGSLGVYEIKGDSIDINEIPVAAEASCFCWSPKGKQLAVGSKRGQITQYKPDLKAVKVTNAPPLEGQHSLISLQWISSYQFVGIYQSSQEDSQAKLIVVDAPKAGETSYTNYDDVCYSGASRLPQFFMTFLQQWNLLLVASSNSSELAVLGHTSDSWRQYIIGDAARAELPLNDGEDTFPVGLALDIGNTKPLPWGESSIPPCPYVLMLSHAGLLCFFNLVNLKQGLPTICISPDPVPDFSGRHFTTEAVQTVETVPNPKSASEISTASSPLQSQSLFGQNVIQPLTFGQAPSTQSFNQVPLPTSGMGTSNQPSSFSGLLSSIAPSGSLFGSSNLIGNSAPAAAALPTTSESFKPTGTNQFFASKSINEIQSANTGSNMFGTSPSVSPSGNKATSAQTLFGGQTTITAAKPQFSSSSNDKYGAIISALNSPPPVTANLQNRPIIIPKPKLETKPVIKQPIPIMAGATQSSNPEPSNDSAGLDSMISTLIKRESAALESELKALLQQARGINIDIGTENEKTYMTEKIMELQEFIKEIDDVNADEQEEVHTLKGDLIMTWAQYEEAQLHYNTSKDEDVMLLLKSQPLDSATEKRQANMRKLMYYIESQLAQASKALDEQWDNFQDYAKKTYRVQMPTMESIYQTMVRQNAIMQKQNYIIKDASNSLKHKPKNTKTPCLLLSLENPTGLEESLEKLQINENCAKRHLYEKALRQAEALTKSKTERLRSFLKKREVGHVTALKPELSASILQTPPHHRKWEPVSILGGHMTPIEKPGAARSLDFIQSTPINKGNVDVIKAPPNTPSHVEPQKAFIFKSPEMATTAPAFSSQVPTTITSMNKPSAFVPATQSTNTFTFTASSKNMQSSKTNPMFSFGGNTTSAMITKPDSAPLNFSKPVSFSSSFSFANTASSATVTTKPTPVFATPATKPSFFGVSSTSQTHNTDTKSEISIVSLTSKSAEPSIKSVPVVTTAAVTPPLSSLQISSTTSVPKASLENEKPQIKPPIVQVTTAKIVLAPQSSLPTIQHSESKTTISSAGSLLTQTSVGLSGTSPLSVPSNLVVSSTSAITAADYSAVPKTTPAFGTNPILGIAQPNATTSASSPFAFGLVGTVASKTTTSSIFGATTTSSASGSVFGSTSSQPMSSSAGTSTKTIFGSTAASTTENTSAQSIFGSPITTTAATTRVQSIFGATSTVPVTGPQPTFESTITTATNTNTPSIFGATSTSPVTGDQSIFGSTAPTTVAVSSAQPIFETVPTTSAPSIFGATATSTVPTTSAPSIFGATSTSPVPTTSVPSIFGTTSTSQVPTTSAPSLFGATSTSPVPTTSAPSIFAVTSTSPVTSVQPIFGSTITTTVATSNAPSIFGATSTSPITSAQPIFGMTSNSPVAQPIFGTSANATAAQSTFGSTTNAVAPSAFGSSSSIFGPQTTTATQTGIFGSVSTTKPLFGASTVTSQPGIFGSNVTNNSQAPIFGTPPDATTSSSVFGGAAAVSTQSSIFGTPVTQNSIFASPSTTQSSIFGGTSTTKPSFGTPTTTPFGSSSPFGQTTSVFGTPKTTTSTFGSSPFGNTSVFGSAPVATTASVFGQPSTFGVSSPPVFGTSTAAGSPNSSSFGTASSAGNVFGQPATSSFSFANTGNTGNTGSFGFGGLNVGSSSTTSSSIFGGSSFGQNTTVANPFSRTDAAKPTFGSSGGSIFGGSNSAPSSGSIFGSGNGSTFGGSQTATFGSSGVFSQQSSTFGQPSSFGSPSQPGPFSSGGTGVGQTGFGSPGAFQKPTSGFGSAPVFGGSPQQGFGAAPSFGGSPAFGSAPAFASPTKVFGSNTPTAAFGSSTTGSPGFGNLANQNTIGFGNLAQQAPTSSSSGFSGNSSFSSWR